MSLVFYLKLYHRLTNSEFLSISKKNQLKLFIYNEYKLSKIKKQKLKIGQLRFYYNPIIYDKNLMLPQFELKSANSNSSVKSSTTQNPPLIRFLLRICVLLGVIIFFKYLSHYYSFYLLGDHLNELDDFLLDTVFQFNDQNYFLDPNIKEALKNLLF